MFKLIVVLAVFYGIAIYFKVRRKVILTTLALVYGFVLFLVLVLPETHFVIINIGSSFAELLLLTIIMLLIGAYSFILKKIKKKNIEKNADIKTGSEMSESEIERYARHIILKEIGGPGQQKMRDAKVLVIGAGGLGNPVSLYLAAAGVGTIGIIDHDEVSLSNLQRQILFRDEDIGISKVFASQKNLSQLNPHIIIKPYNRILDEKNAQNLIKEYDLIIDGTDNLNTRHLINLACIGAEKPLISGAISQWEGQISLFDPKNNFPCYSCLFPKTDNDNMVKSCAEVGVLGSLPGVIGSLMAVEAIKEINGIGKSLRGFLILYDALNCEVRKVEAEKDPKCVICN